MSKKGRPNQQLVALFWLFSIGQRIDDGAGRRRATNPAISGKRDSGLSEQCESRPRYQLKGYMYAARQEASLR